MSGLEKCYGGISSPPLCGPGGGRHGQAPEVARYIPKHFGAYSVILSDTRVEFYGLRRDRNSTEIRYINWWSICRRNSKQQSLRHVPSGCIGTPKSPGMAGNSLWSGSIGIWNSATLNVHSAIESIGR